jgi:glycerol-3-phosphate acyltransferase PlsX
MKIIIDVMGGDHAPDVGIEAGARAARELNVDVVLVGDTGVIEKKLKMLAYPKERIEIAHADEVITNYEEPAKAVRHKKNASVVVAARMLREGRGDAMLSMGNTGALLSAGLLVVGRIRGVHRPAIATLLPTKEGPKLLLDAGANTNCKSENLVQFGIMGSIYMKQALGYDSPRVGLISNGEEEGKGDSLVKETYPLMKEQSFNYIGNVEGRDVMEGNAEVFVCDGFVGNVILKTIEGMGSVVGGMVKGLFMKNIGTKVSALLVSKGLKDFKKMMDYREYGGAPLLGLRRPVIKGHGSSDAKAVYYAIVQAKKFVETNVNAEIERDISKMEVKKDD